MRRRLYPEPIGPWPPFVGPVQPIRFVPLKNITRSRSHLARSRGPRERRARGLRLRVVRRSWPRPPWLRGRAPPRPVRDADRVRTRRGRLPHAHGGRAGRVPHGRKPRMSATAEAGLTPNGNCGSARWRTAGTPSPWSARRPPRRTGPATAAPRRPAARWPIGAARTRPPCRPGWRSATRSRSTSTWLSDPSLAATVRGIAVEVFGLTPFERVGRRPEDVPRSSAPAPDVVSSSHKAADGSGDGVDILADGRQVVAFGLHRDTRQPYRWVGDASPLDARPEAAPTITAAQVDEFLLRVEAVMPLYGGGGKAAGGGHKARGGTSREIVRDASGRVVDGREQFLTSCVWRATNDLHGAKVDLTAETVAGGSVGAVHRPGARRGPRRRRLERRRRPPQGEAHPPPGRGRHSRTRRRSGGRGRRGRKADLADLSEQGSRDRRGPGGGAGGHRGSLRGQLGPPRHSDRDRRGEDARRSGRHRGRHLSTAF